ncbi:MAG: threonylcarbamoyl-AMP synthase [Candidatus Aminicenantes bacterium]|nr:threonylcarbamoyl-AMP synthase [Candidatus Aminicenantes bacterium]
MKTAFLKIPPAAVFPRAIGHIARTMRNGGLVVFPTDTFYGLGGDALSAEVIREVYGLKRREASKPLLVLIEGIEMAAELAEDIPPLFWRAAEKFWPGPLTVVLKASPRVPRELGAGTGTIAMRLPDVPWLRELVRETGFPVIATSANVAGAGEINDGREAKQVFDGQVALIVDGGRTPGGPPSTVLDLTAPAPKILRRGAVPEDSIREALGV